MLKRLGGPPARLSKPHEAEWNRIQRRSLRLQRVCHMSRRYSTVNVFTREKYGGNPLAVVLEADGLSDQEMLKIAREFNYSETAFVCRPKDPSNTAKVRIFTPGCRGSVCRSSDHRHGIHSSPVKCGVHSGLKEVRLEERAGLVPVRLIYEK